MYALTLLSFDSPCFRQPVNTVTEKNKKDQWILEIYGRLYALYASKLPISRALSRNQYFYLAVGLEHYRSLPKDWQEQIIENTNNKNNTDEVKEGEEKKKSKKKQIKPIITERTAIPKLEQKKMLEERLKSEGSFDSVELITNFQGLACKALPVDFALKEGETLVALIDLQREKDFIQDEQGQNILKRQQQLKAKLYQTHFPDIPFLREAF
jgi:hypothetical protein